MLRHKDFERTKLEKLITLLEKGQPLDRKYKDHELRGNMTGTRECHVQNDVLLLYRKEKDILVLLLIDIGTHSSLFV